VVAEAVHRLADDISPMYKKFAPESYRNMTAFEPSADDCRVGHHKGRPFSGATSSAIFAPTPTGTPTTCKADARLF